uniref:Uncharacterized protein n=1 Tax=Knipowitschia caucasica TaxID=637954 RepID=A0AAV2JUR9_KNICA
MPQSLDITILETAGPNHSISVGFQALVCAPPGLTGTFTLHSKTARSWYVWFYSS